MSNETDLDWLARNVHVWPEITPQSIPTGDRTFEYGCTFYENHICIYHKEFANSIVIHKNQWLARRAELQNKPSWETHEYKVIAQGRNGSWYGSNYSEEKFGHENSFCITGTGWNFICSGVDLGDWRDTLENRPYFSATNCTVTSSGSFGVTVGETADLSEQAVTARLQEATDNVLAAVPELKSEKYKFDPFTSIEDNQEHEMKQDNGWFERGELPPVGSQCEVMHRDSWVVCGVIAHFQQKAAMVAAYTVDNGNALKSLDSCIAKYFRPIPTERDVLADLIESHGQMSALIVADAIIAAGFKLEAK